MQPLSLMDFVSVNRGDFTVYKKASTEKNSIDTLLIYDGYYFSTFLISTICPPSLLVFTPAPSAFLNASFCQV